MCIITILLHKTKKYYFNYKKTFWLKHNACTKRSFYPISLHQYLSVYPRATRTFRTFPFTGFCCSASSTSFPLPFRIST